MSHSQTLNNLVDVGINLNDFQVSAKDLDQQFGQIGKILLNLGWLAQDYATGFQCSQCGSVHEVVVFNNKYFIGCDVDSDSGLEELNKDDLLIYRFSASKFFTWLNQVFSLQGDVKSSDDKVLLGQGAVNGKQRLFIFSQHSSLKAREKLYRDHPANHAVILYFSTALDNHSQGYDINLAEHLVVQDNSLSIDVSSALSVIEDTIPPLASELQTTSGGYAIELKLTDDKIVLTGMALGGSYPAFKAKRSSVLFRLIRTLLKLHKDSKETTSQTYAQSAIETNYIDPRNDKTDDLSNFNLGQSKRSLSKLCSSLLTYFLSHSHHKDDGLVIEFKSALSQEDWNKLSDSEKQKILASKAS